MWMETSGRASRSGIARLRDCGIRREQAPGFAAEQHRRQLLDALLHDQQQRDEQGRADDHGDLRAKDEIMRHPIIDDVGRPGADPMRGQREHACLHRRDPRDDEDRQGQQQAKDHRRHRLQRPIRALHRPVEREFRVAPGIEQAPIGTDAAFEGLPRLVEGLDDRIFDPHRLGPGDEIAHDLRLGERARHGGLAVQSGARPAELGDHDALAGIGLPQALIVLHRMIDGGDAGNALPNKAGRVRRCSRPPKRAPGAGARCSPPRPWSPERRPRASRAGSWRSGPGRYRPYAAPRLRYIAFRCRR